MLSLYGKSCINYSGVCKQYLPVQVNNATLLSTLTHNEISEADVIAFMQVLKQNQNIFSEKCDINKIVLPFLCQYVYPPCNHNNVDVYSPQLISRGQCKNIRDLTCDFEWRLVTAASPSLSSVLPVCENFIDNDFGLDNGSNSLDVPQPLQCHYQFKEYCGLCLPLCGKFSQYNIKTKLQERSVLIFSGISAFFGGILVFFAAIVRRNQL